MISYSYKSRPAVARLMRHYNDVDIYVEDSTYVGVYERLANAALSGRGKVTTVTALGPKELVLKAAFADTKHGGRPRLYIVDGDLELLSKGRHKGAPHLYRLRVYSLENLVFEMAGAEKYASYCCPKLTKDAALRTINISEISKAMDSLLPLFCLLAIGQRLGVSGPEFAFNPPSVSIVDRGYHVSVDVTKIRQRIKSCLRAILQQKKLSDFRHHKATVIANIKRRNLSGVHAVPAKAFLIPMLNARIGHAGGNAHKQSSIVSYLAEHCNFSQDPLLRRRIRNLLPA